MPKKKRVPKGLTPIESKKPRIDPSLKNPLDEFPVWRIGMLDLAGQWGWDKIDGDLFFNEIQPKIKHFEGMTWNEILNRNNHEISIDKINKNAQKRLTQINNDDIESLVSLRLTGPKRIWGIRDRNILKIIWWDPKHQVCPSKRKHT